MERPFPGLPKRLQISGNALSFSGQSLRAGIIFGLFVFWLLAFPMAGPLSASGDSNGSILFFLAPHTVCLLLVGIFWPRNSFPRCSLIAVSATLALTLAFPLLADWQNLLMVGCGITAAPVSIRAGMQLHQSPQPLAAAAIGLVIGNVLLLLLFQISLPAMLGYIGAAAALTALAAPIRPAAAGSLQGLYRYLPAVFVFQLVSGLMYLSLMPAYAEFALWHGAELPFYLLTVLLAIKVLRHDREFLLVLGVIFGWLAFFCLHAETPIPVNLAMFSMQAAAGCIDMLLLACMLHAGNSQKAFGIGNGVLGAGILLGAGCSWWFEGHAGATLVLSQLALNGAVLILYLQNRRAGLKGERNFDLNFGEDSSSLNLFSEWHFLLSSQERQVLELVWRGRTYREVARALEISDSSVKTYMHRIYGKLGVTNKKSLLRVLSQKINAR